MQRSLWRRTLHQWHWISSALCLSGMLLFTITGITLNHADRIHSPAKTIDRHLHLPDALLEELTEDQSNRALSDATAEWLEQQFGLSIDQSNSERSADEVYVSMPGPGTDTWLSIDLVTGDVEYSRTDRGWIAYFNDLHKGRHTGRAWKWFLDVFALACLVFCITGFLLLWLHARHRSATWPATGLGLIVPIVIALLLIH